MDRVRGSHYILLHPEVPALPGCGSQGDSVEEAIEMTKDAIEGALEALPAHGKPIPEDKDVVVKVTVAA